MAYNAEITLDLVLILRLLVALFFGIFYAVLLEFSRSGRNLRTNMTTFAVVIGVGMDLAIAYDADWWTTVGVVALSSVGIIGRCLLLAPNENGTNDKASNELGRYKLNWIFSDLAGDLNEIIVDLRDLLNRADLKQKESAMLTNALGLAFKAESVVKAARRGEYEQRK